MMRQLLRDCIAVSVVSGLLLKLCPETGAKRVAALMSAVVLCLTVIRPLKDFDFDSYALQSARLHEAEEALNRNTADVTEKLNRLVMEESYAAYLADKAAEYGLDGIRVELQLQWALDGLWIPYAAHIRGSWDEPAAARFRELLTVELGVPPERQYWYHDE